MDRFAEKVSILLNRFLIFGVFLFCEPVSVGAGKLEAADIILSQGRESVICEIIWAPFPMKIGPYTSMYDSFYATKDGKTNSETFASIVGDWVSEKDVRDRGIDIPETPERRKKVQVILDQLQSQGWKSYDHGKYWYSYRLVKYTM